MAHVLAIFFVFISPVIIYAKLLVSCLTLASAYYVYVKYQELSKVRSLWVEKDKCYIEYNGEKIFVKIIGDVFSSTHLIVLSVKFFSENKKISLICMADSMEKEHHRKLRVLIRCGELVS